VNLPVTAVPKISEGGHHIAAMVEAGEIDLIINTPLGRYAYDDNQAMRSAAIRHSVPLLTTLSAAQAAVNGIKALRQHALKVKSLHYLAEKLSES
jgi:carbamoyl-phosphate synthase large subunit